MKEFLNKTLCCNMLRVTLVLVLLANVFCSGERKGRVFGYGGPHTVTLVEEKLVTAWEPTSCIHLAPSLKPCLKVRSIRNFPIFGGGQQPTSVANNIQQETKRPVTPVQNATANGTVHITPLSWGEYLGFRAPTVTVVSTQIKTTTIIDPNVYIKFTVRGCRPFDLPPDMETCSIEATPTLDIQPTSVDTNYKPIAHTAVLTPSNLNGINSIEGTEEEIFSDSSNTPTQILNND